MDTMKSTSLWTASLGALLLLHACYTEPNGNGGSESAPPDVTGMSLSVNTLASMKSLRISGLVSTSTNPGVLHIDGDNLSGCTYKLCGTSTPMQFKSPASNSAVELLVKLDGAAAGGSLERQWGAGAAQPVAPAIEVVAFDV